jgi:hypothetical protein
MTIDDFLSHVQAGLRPTLPYFVGDIPNLLEIVSSVDAYLERIRI